MTARRRAIELSIGGEDLAKLVSITRSRTESAGRVERARMLLAYREDPSFFAVGRALDVHHQTVQRCVERALADANDPAYEFEAGFGPDGAVCVHHVRVKENATLAGVEASSSRLKGRVGETCDEALARQAGALVFVRSPP